MNRDFKGVWIPKDIWLNEELDITEKAIFAEIDSLDGPDGCKASNEHFIKFFKVSESTITRAISHLKKLGLIESEFDGRVRTLRVVKLTRQSSQIDEESNTSITNTINTNNHQELLIQDNNKEDTYKEKRQNFVDKFNEICVSLPKCVRITPKRIKGINNLIKKYSESEIVEVFNKLEASDFCSGRKVGSTWRADIDFILREDKFINVMEGRYDNQGKKCNVETISRGEKKNITAEERERIIRNGKKF